jgi:ABC-type transport system involved in Fe-S cluster assembly fused permease/ATPase subunit
MHWIVIMSFYVGFTANAADSHIIQKVYPKSFDSPAECKVWQELLVAEAEKTYGSKMFAVQCYGLDSGAFEP